MHLTYRFAVSQDIPLLAEMNYRLIRDEGHSNPMTVRQLAERMRGWLEGDYSAVLFDDHDVPVAYALYREAPGTIYLRHFYVEREHRRRGIGRAAIALLRAEVWPAGRAVRVECLSANTQGLAFWRNVGFSDYCVTLEMPPTP